MFGSPQSIFCMVMVTMVEGEEKKKTNSRSPKLAGHLTLDHVGRRNVVLSLMESLERMAGPYKHTPTDVNTDWASRCADTSVDEM